MEPTYLVSVYISHFYMASNISCAVYVLEI